MGFFDRFKKKKETPATQQTFDKFCPKCGAGVKRDAPKCPNCGFDFNTRYEKQSESAVKVETNAGPINLKVEVYTPVNSTRELESYVRNGITYRVFANTEVGYTMTTSVPEYNEVLVFYTFLSKYPTIKAPSDLRECDYPHFMFSNIGIEVVGKVHKELFDKGFYEKAGNRDALVNLKVGEIKEIIGKLGLSIKGKKEDLIDGLISQADEYELKNLINSQYYKISENGRQWMSDHELEYEYYTSEKEYSSFESYKRVRSKKSPDDIRLEESLKEIATDKVDFGRYAYDSVISILKKKGDNRGIVVCYLKELLIDMSGALNYDGWKRCNFARDIIRETNIVAFTPYLLRTFPTLKDFYEPSMIEEAYSIKLPVNACSIEDFRDIAEMMLDGTMDESTQKAYISKLSAKLVEIGIEKH